MSTPKIETPKPPAKAPERQAGVEEGDILLGTEDPKTSEETGRRSLQRPSGFTGLSV